MQNARYLCSAIALKTTSLCAIPFQSLEQLSLKIPQLSHQLFRIMSKKIASDKAFLTLITKKKADVLLATLLVNLSTRLKQRNFSETEFFLRLTRKDIGSYLGLTIETVSRLFSRFRDEGLIETECQYVRLLNLTQLKKL